MAQDGFRTSNLSADSEDAFRSKSIQDMMSLKGRVTVVTGKLHRHIETFIDIAKLAQAVREALAWRWLGELQS
jgi:hypothetical protein